MWYLSLSPLLSPVKAMVKLAHWLFCPVVFCQAILTALALDSVEPGVWADLSLLSLAFLSLHP